MNIVLGNIDYLKHTSSEGQELQQGLVEAGWTIVGPGYDGLSDAGAILERYKPDRIFVQDCRDWLPESDISFRKDIGYTNLAAIGASGIPAFTVLKDAWGWLDLQSRVAIQIKARGIFAYYRLELVRRVAPWTAVFNLTRFHHTVDEQLVRSAYQTKAQRRPALVSGALQPCYPLRARVFENADRLNLDTVHHPGYGNRGMNTPHYLRRLSGYKVHVATASQWGCAFRKIIESVACGVTPITNLPPWDVLPMIDGALVRIPDMISLLDLDRTIQAAARAWNEDERRDWSDKALAYYDWRVSGKRTAATMEAYVRGTAIS